MLILATTPSVTLSLHPGPHPVLEVQWLGYVGSTDFRAAALHALALSQHHHVHAWVADDRLLGAVRPRDLDWAQEAILTPLNTLALRRFAQLEPVEGLNRLTIRSLYERTMPSLQVAFRTFDNLLQARQWAGGGD